MEKQIGVISTGFWGLNKNMVNEHLQKLIKQHTNNITKLNQYIGNKSKEKESLEEELAALQEYEKSYVMTEAMKSVVSKRVKEVPVILSNAADIEISGTIEHAKRDLYLMDAKISAIHIETQHSKEYIDLLMKDIGKIFNEEEVDKDIECAQTCAVMADETFIAENTSCEESEIESLINTSESVQLSESEGVEEVNISHQPQNKGFWEEDDETFTMDFAVENENIQEKVPDTGSLTLKANTTSTIENKVRSEALSTEIRSIRSKYLIGKIAGENLCGNDGNLIIAKAEVISHEVIEKADNEGKLAELIINMTIPEIIN